MPKEPDDIKQNDEGFSDEMNEWIPVIHHSRFAKSKKNNKKRKKRY